MRIFLSTLFFFSLHFFTPPSWAAPEPVIKGGVISEDGAYVFAKPDFDSEVLATLAPGGVYYISKALTKGIFHKIKVKQGMMGYVSTSDVKPLSKKDQKFIQVEEERAKKELSKKKSDPQKSEEPERRKSFEFSRYWGASVSQIDFREDTMGDKRKDSMLFYGAKFSGSNVLISGAMQTDVNLMISPNAPAYYEGATKRSANGFVFIANMFLDTYWPQTPNWLNYFGFGPMFRYSRFDVTMYDSTLAKDVGYSLEDMNLGAVFHLGAAFRFGSRMALRVEASYFWESVPYYGFSLAPQISF